MPRYIDADALIDFLDVGHLRHPSELCFSEVDVANLLLHAPALSPDDVRGVGEWEDAKQHGLCRCSVCKDCYIEKDYITQAKWKYCPSCGAKMEVSEDARKN